MPLPVFGNRRRTPAGEEVYAARSARDLGQPMYIAFSAALEAGAERFILELAPGTYENVSLSLSDSRSRPELALVVRGRGPAPAVLQRGMLNLRGSFIHLQNLVLTEHDGAVSPLMLDTTSDVLAEDLVLLGNRCGESFAFGDSMSDAPLVQVSAHAGDGKGSLILRRCWLLGNDLRGSGSLISTYRLAGISLEECLLADNVARSGLKPFNARRLDFHDCLVHETRLGDHWLSVNALLDATFAGGLLSLSVPVARHFLLSDTRAADLRPLRIAGAALALSAPPEPALASLQETRVVGRPALPGDLARTARGARRPSVRALLARHAI